MIKPPRRIFIANIPWTVGRQELKTHFEKFGPLLFCYVAFDWTTGMSKGFGFVKFKTLESHEKALKKPQQEVEGQNIFVKEALD